MISGIDSNNYIFLSGKYPLAMPDGTPRRGRLSQQEWDTIFAILSHPVRRTVVQTLEREDSLSMDELAEVASEELEMTKRDVCIQLTHIHLPKLDSAGYLNYQHGEDEIVSTEELENLVEIIRNVNEAAG